MRKRQRAEHRKRKLIKLDDEGVCAGCCGYCCYGDSGGVIRELRAMGRRILQLQG